MDALTVDRIQFAFTATFHYLFPQLTMGLALLIVVLKTLAIRTRDRHYSEAARFLGPRLRHQFRCRRGDWNSNGVPVRHQLVGVLENRRRRDQTNACNGRVFSFFLESTFLGAFLFGEKQLGRWPGGAGVEYV
jgi:cytochrome bd ubiquinol oxidase subunit I